MLQNPINNQKRGCLLFSSLIYLSHQNETTQITVRRYKMQGSFGDATERFRGGKKKDTQQAKYHEKDKAWRKKRRDRHQDAD